MNQPKDNSLVSVLICSHNASSFIAGTLESVSGQSYGNLEILVLDNNSSDNTVEIIRALALNDKRIKLFAQDKNTGPYYGLNFLLDKARGAYIAINDHDDIWHTEKLERQISLLESEKKFTACGSAVINRYEKYNSLIYRSRPEISDTAWHTSLVFRNNGYRYDPAVKVATDFHFMRNVLSKDKSSIYNFPEPLVLRRIFAGDSNLSGKWMKGLSLPEIMKLNIGLIDKLALLNRALMPRDLVEWLIVKTMGNNVPDEYAAYYNELASVNLRG